MEIDSTRISETSLTFSDYYSYDAEAKSKLFDFLVSIKQIKTVETATSIGRMLILLCRDDSDSERIVRSKVIEALVNVVKVNTDTESNLQGLVITLIRYCMESHKVLESYMNEYVTRLLGNNRKDLTTVVKEYTPHVMRSSAVFTKTLSDASILYKCASPLKNLAIVGLDPEQKKLIDSDTPMSDSDNQPFDSGYSTGIMQFLLSELMIVGKKDLTVSPEPSKDDDENKNETLGSQKNVRKKKETSPIFKNKDYAYAVFLLQTIAELLFSYKQAKTEFLTFSKKSSNPFELGKPRSTALNLLIHQFVPSDPFKSDKSFEATRRRVLSMVSGVCIFALVSTTPVKGIDHSDSKLVDPDMTFVRKFTVDILIKMIKESSTTSKPAAVRYGRIVDILNLVCKLLGEKYDYDVTSIVDKKITVHDPYFFAVELLDKKFPSVLSSILADLDVNFPYTEKVSSHIMKCMSSLCAIRVENRDLFKDGHQSG
ncbi:unnamed protein product [Ambrosiozyma monospora]|uniref:Unnamed protein product n=1 Tax=Ambrosiozyma monospora TaxID=43982 RepID=A0A9W7DJ92_AMBMO|nr:unnamed protein product [Ambrosiozyma monospora]